MIRVKPCLCMLFVVLMAGGVPPRLAHAQSDYPSRPVRLVIPFAPGGNTDISGRVLAAKLSPLLGQQFIIDNRAGADGAIGSAEVARRAKPDGYTLLLGTGGSHIISPLTRKDPAFDPVKDFAPIAVFAVVSQGYAAHPSVAKSLQELIKRVKSNPGKFSYGSAGLGGLGNLAGELFKRQAGGLDIVHIPYKGGGPSVQDLMAGQIPLAVVSFSSTLELHRSGKVRLLAVFSEKRLSTAADVPTAIESGIPGMVAYSFTVLLAPTGTPKPVIDRLYDAVAKIMADPAFHKELTGLGLEAVTDSSPDKAAQFIRDEIARWAPIVKAVGVSAQ